MASTVLSRRLDERITEREAELAAIEKAISGLEAKRVKVQGILDELRFLNGDAPAPTAPIASNTPKTRNRKNSSDVVEFLQKQTDGATGPEIANAIVGTEETEEAKKKRNTIFATLYNLKKAEKIKLDDRGIYRISQPASVG